MNRTLLAALAFASIGLAACDRPASSPTVVTVPSSTVPVPVPGPAGATGATGATGSTGNTGSSGATVIVTPPAPAASN